MYCGNTECPVHANMNIFENVALIFPFSKKKKKIIHTNGIFESISVQMKTGFHKLLCHTTWE